MPWHPSQDFGRSVNPISTGGRWCPPHYYSPPPPPDFQTFLRPCSLLLWSMYVRIPLSLENVRHSEPTSITRSPTTSPHIEHIISPVIRKRMNYNFKFCSSLQFDFKHVKVDKFTFLLYILQSLILFNVGYRKKMDALGL